MAMTIRVKDMNVIAVQVSASFKIRVQMESAHLHCKQA
jgi:hypothetical protein